MRTCEATIVLLACALASGNPGGAAAQSPTSSSPAKSQIDAEQLFATICGWCHTDGGRVAGKGPQLMNDPHPDDFLRNRIEHGKEGAMPAFGTMFSSSDIDAIIHYIRSLKPQG